VTAVEEMLHLCLVANVMNAVGGSPDLTRPGFVPSYPARLPDGEEDFIIDLRPFSPAAVNTFCQIERPRKAPDAGSRLVPQETDKPKLVTSPTDEGMSFYSIGEFYEEIGAGLRRLAEQDPDLFSGDESRQVGPEFFYSGGGAIIPVRDLESACKALQFIGEQGEGLDAGLYDTDGELAHYYRFRQLQLGRYYQPGDEPEAPSGPKLTIDWEQTFNLKVSARLSDYPAGSELAAAAEAFNADYAEFLALLTAAFNGQPDRLQEAIWWMFRLRDGFNRLIRNPLPGTDGLHAAPTFEVNVPERVS